jgi:N-carbamoyl-L-amino-acid hydrolase
VPFAPKVQALVAASAQARGLSHQRLVFSRAGHDCQEMARLCPAGMVFVPGEYGGISHNQREFSTIRQVTDGVNVLLYVVTALAGRMPNVVGRATPGTRRTRHTRRTS